MADLTNKNVPNAINLEGEDTQDLLENILLEMRAIRMMLAAVISDKVDTSELSD